MNVLDLDKAFNNKTIIEAICAWNAARYDQELDPKLQVSLIMEETDETLAAHEKNDLVEVCDGYADVFFVAIGGLWKAGLSAEEITDLLDMVQQDMPSIPPLAAAATWFVYTPMTEIGALVALSAHNDMSKVLGSEQAALDVIRAVCVSNGTKAVKKTAAGVKANIDKGENFVPPTEAIKTILSHVSKGVYKHAID